MFLYPAVSKALTAWAWKPLSPETDDICWQLTRAVSRVGFSRPPKWPFDSILKRTTSRFIWMTITPGALEVNKKWHAWPVWNWRKGPCYTSSLEPRTMGKDEAPLAQFYDAWSHYGTNQARAFWQLLKVVDAVGNNMTPPWRLLRGRSHLTCSFYSYSSTCIMCLYSAQLDSLSALLDALSLSISFNIIHTWWIL